MEQRFVLVSIEKRKKIIEIQIDCQQNFKCIDVGTEKELFRFFKKKKNVLLKSCRFPSRKLLEQKKVWKI
jgi:hypothetical protein